MKGKMIMKKNKQLITLENFCTLNNIRYKATPEFVIINGNCYCKKLTFEVFAPVQGDFIKIGSNIHCCTEKCLDRYIGIIADIYGLSRCVNATERQVKP